MKIQLVAKKELHYEEIKNLGVPDRWNENDMFEMSENENTIVFQPVAPNSAGTKCDINLQKNERYGVYTICSQDNEIVLFIKTNKQIVLLFRSEVNGPLYLFLLFEKHE